MTWHLFAQVDQETKAKAVDATRGIFELDPHFWPNLWGGLIGALVFGLLGILLMAIGFKIFDWLMPRIDFERELAEKNNIAVSVLSAAIVIGIAIIVAIVIK